MKRLQASKPWLVSLIRAMLPARRLALKAAHPVRVRIVDGSSLSVPGSQGTDYRLPLSLDLGRQRIDGVETSDARGRETLARPQSQPGDIWLADRGYARRPGLDTLLSAKEDIVVRLGGSTFPLGHEDGPPFDLVAWPRQLPAAEAGEQDVKVTPPDGVFSQRLIARRLPPEVAGRARQRIRQQVKKKGRTPDRCTLEVAGDIILVTSLPASQWTAPQGLALYRLRWQVELICKRLKSSLDFDAVCAKGPALAQTYLLGKVWATRVIDTLTDQAARRHPEPFVTAHCPVSAWRWMTLGRNFLFAAVRGHLSGQRFLDKLPDLKRYLGSNSRRKRQGQAVTARSLLDRLLGATSCEAPCPRLAHMRVCPLHRLDKGDIWHYSRSC